MTPTLDAPVRIEPRPHCAKFSEPILDAIRFYLDAVDPHGTWRVLDPFAGVGRIHRLATCPDPSHAIRPTIGSELEAEWIVQGGARSLVADAHSLPFADGTFDAIVTSPCYGNRMADLYDGKGQCRKCAGHPAALDGTPCDRCDGTGRDQSERNTYRIKLDRPLTRNSAAGLRWGPAYRKFHRTAWAECVRVLRRPEPGRPVARFILNTSDHMRLGERQPVTRFHVDTLRALGLSRVGRLDIATRRNRNGAGAHDKRARVEAENVTVFELREDPGGRAQ